ncbi:MAG: VWA domain-containing protein [Candidatus Cloacimonetes bacterium]|nr:VWA domain-containing protein [Candidatus Cloacimonadota bacterium]
MITKKITLLVFLIFCSINVFAKYKYEKLADFEWNNKSGFETKLTHSGNYAILSFEILDNNRVAFLSNVEKDIKIYSKDGKFINAFDLDFIPEDFVYNNNKFYVLSNYLIYEFNDSGALLKKYSVNKEFKFINRLSAFKNDLYVLTSDEKSYPVIKNSFYLDTISQINNEINGWLLEENFKCKTIKLSNNTFSLQISNQKNLNLEKIYDLDKKLATVTILGKYKSKLFLNIEYFKNEVPIKIEREILVYSLTEKEIVNKMKLPNMHFIYMKHDIKINDNGAFYFITTPKKGILYQLIYDEKLNKNIVPNFKEEYHYNEHLLRIKEESIKNSFPKEELPISRAEIIQNAAEYESIEWTASDYNISINNTLMEPQFWNYDPGQYPDDYYVHYIDNQSAYIKTPDWVTIGQKQKVPYKWGGWTEINTFEAQISSGAYAGDVYISPPLPSPYHKNDVSWGPTYCVGVDCSGLVSRAWDLSQKYGTSTLPDISTAYSTFSELKHGDIINKAGYHVRLVISDNPNGTINTIESSAVDWRVSYRNYDLNDLADYTPRYYYNLIETNYSIEIQQPTTTNSIAVGEHDNPYSFESRVRVFFDSGQDITDLVKNNFTVEIGGIQANVISSIYNDNGYADGYYILNIMPPQQSNNGSYDYTVKVDKYNTQETDTETDAINYQGQSNIDVVQVIDVSGSMGNGFYAPGVYYLQTAKDAGNLFVDQMEVGDMIGICSFSSGTSVDYYLREIESGGNQQQGAKNAINSLSAGGGTTIGGGLQTGQAQFTQHGNPSHPWGMILLSDGDENTAPYVADILPNIIPTQTKVYTISFGIYSNESLMQDIATATDGQYFNLPDPTTQDMLNVYNSIKGSMGNQQTFNIWQGVVQTGASTTENISIETGVTNGIFTVTWDNASDDLYFELLDPGPDGISGTGDDIIIDPTYAANNPDIVTLTTGDTYKYYTFPSPNSGEWILTISNTLKSRNEICFTATVTGESDVVINSFFGSDNYFINNPIKVVVTLADYATPIINADVNVAIEAPTVTNIKWSNSNAEYEKAGRYIGGSKSQNYRTDYMTLYDDGLHGDGLADDGVYANIYTQTDIEGSYSFDIDATGINTLGETFSRFSTMSTYVNAPSYTGSISGEISYDGVLTGNIYVGLWANDPQMVTTPVIVITLNEPGSYLIEGLPDNINYYLNAYMDVNGNTSYDECEPIGIYENNPIYIDSGQSITGVNVTIIEMEIPTSVLQQGWNMVSVPCEPNPSDPSSIFSDDIIPFLTNTYNSNIWWWSELNSSYWVPDEIENGYGYWIRAWEDSTEIDAEGDLVTESVSFVLTNSANYYLMQHGFHMLGNPYGYPITFGDNNFEIGPENWWCAVWNNSDHSYDYYDYNDNFIIDPWKAYWVQTLVDNETITINPTTKGSSFFAAISSNNSTRGNKENSDWDIKFEVEQGVLKDQSNWAGINENASDTWDSMDIPEIPPMTSEYISLFFPHNDWNQYSADYTRDVRSYDLGNPQWNFVVNSTESGEAKLTWNIPDEVPDEYTLQLEDLENNITINIESITEYVFDIIAQNEHEFVFTVVPLGVGPDPDIPTTFSLSANYPNPFTQSTEIQYQLPERSQVDISIYNVKGQRIKVLESDQVEPGYYKISWNGLDEHGKKVSPGIYFYTIHAKGNCQEYKHCNKMLLIR